MKNLEQEHPLIKTIKLKKKAIKKKAHPILISKLEKIIEKRTKESVNILLKSDYITKIIEE